MCACVFTELGDRVDVRMQDVCVCAWVFSGVGDREMICLCRKAMTRSSNTHAHALKHAHTHIHIHTHTRNHTRIHTRTQTHTHTHTHTHKLALSLSLSLTQVDNCIIGWESKIGAWSRLENCCVLGEDVTCKVGSQRLLTRVCVRVLCLWSRL